MKSTTLKCTSSKPTICSVQTKNNSTNHSGGSKFTQRLSTFAPTLLLAYLFFRLLMLISRWWPSVASIEAWLRVDLRKYRCKIILKLLQCESMPAYFAVLLKSVSWQLLLTFHRTEESLLATCLLSEEIPTSGRHLTILSHQKTLPTCRSQSKTNKQPSVRDKLLSINLSFSCIFPPLICSAPPHLLPPNNLQFITNFGLHSVVLPFFSPDTKALAVNH